MPEQTAALPHPLRRPQKPRPGGPPAVPAANTATRAPEPVAPQSLPGAAPAAFKEAFPDIVENISANISAEYAPGAEQQATPGPATEPTPEIYPQNDPEIPQPADRSPDPAPDFTPAARAIAARRRAAVNRGTVWELVRQLLLFAVLLCAAFGQVFGILPCPDDDMMPRVGAGDLLLYYRLDRAKTPTAGQIIVFDKEGSRRIGRVVAKEGDVVEITDDAQLKVNGNITSERYIYESTPRYDDLVSYPLTLEEGCCFVLCDTREGGHDSRYFGAVTAAERRGRIITVLRRSNL